MNRRNLLIAAGALASVPFSVFAQRPVARPRIGLLWIEAAGDSIVLTALRDGLRAQGYVEGKNIEIDTQFLVDRYDRLAEAAVKLVNEKVDVIVSYGTTATLAACKATSTIPIVMVAGGDPVKLGVVATLSKPGGNVAGVTFLSLELVGKRLEILKEAVPGIRRVGVLLNPASATESTNFVGWEAAARTLNMEVQRVEIRVPTEIDSVIAGVTRQRVEALGVVTSTMFIANRKPIVTAIARIRLPAIYGSADDTDAGGLISYGPNWSDGFHSAAAFVARILKGARPADLPFEQPTRFELAVNLKAAKAIGIAIPPSILRRADKVIE
jgi:putative tryptophan/tyrosine transport system substrate-binding protein